MVTYSDNETGSYHEDLEIVGFTVYYVAAGILIAETLAIMVINSPAIYVIVTNEVLCQCGTNIFIASMCVADILYGSSMVIYQGCFLSDFDKSPSSSRALCARCSLMMASISMIGSLLTTQHIAVERAIATFRPLQYKRWVTSKRAVVIVCLTWTYLCLMVPALVVHYYMGLDDEEKKIVVRDIHGIFSHTVYRYYIPWHLYAPACVSIVVYCSISVAIYKQSRRTAVLVSDINSSLNTAKAERAKQKSLKVTKMSMALLGLMLLTWSPYTISNMLLSKVDYRTHPEEFRNVTIMTRISLLLISLYSLMNIILYAWNQADYKNAFRKLLRRDQVTGNITNTDSTRS